MSFLVKNQKNVPENLPVVREIVHVKRATATLPATTTQDIFAVNGGRIRVIGLFGVVTTIIQAQTTNLKVSVTAKSGTSGGSTVGTKVDIASNVDINALEVGGTVFVEGDGTALVKANAGAILNGTNTGVFIAPIGVINVETGATSTGSIQYELYYEPLDHAAVVTAL